MTKAGSSDIARKTDRPYPLIGIVTPARNRRAWTVGFAQRLAEQDYPIFKLYIVDSASTDGTPEAIRALGLDVVEMLAAPDSAYWTAATNIGVQRALADGCDYVLTINDDAIVANDFLSRLVGAAQSGGARIVGAVISYANEPARLWGVGAYNDFASGAFVQTALANMAEEALRADPGAPPGLVRVDYLCGNGALFHRSVYEEVGLYDVRNTPHYHADTELTMRAERAGIARYCALDARLYNRFTEAGDGAFASKNVRFFSLRSANYVRPLFYILDRYCGVDDRAVALTRYFARYLPGASGRDRSKLLRAIAFLTMPERRKIAAREWVPSSDPDLMLAQDIDLLLNLPPRGFALAAYVYLMRRDCSASELAAYEQAAMSGRARADLLREFVESDEFRNHAGALTAEFARALLKGASAPSGTPRQRALLAFRAVHGRNPTARELAASSPALTPVHGAVPVVYFNVDVPCMAISDQRARTGVHRYVVSLLDALRADPRAQIRIFYSAELRSQFNTLIGERPELRALEADFETPIAQRAVVFYPYFPFGARPVSLARLPQALTVCDLFAVMRPEWFADEAVARFRHQLHSLVGVDHIFCISRATQIDLHRVFPSLKASSSVAYLAADAAVRPKTRFIQFGKIVKRAIAGPYFVCVGTIEPRKNLHNVLAAFARLGREARKLRMIVVGQEGWNVRTQDLLKMEGIDRSRIVFLGRVPDAQLWELYAGAMCVAFPSLGEGFGLPILEAFQCGAPVVTSDVTSMPEIATKGAILVDPNDPDAIAAAILRLARDGALRKRLAQEGYARAQEFSWTQCSDDHMRVFLELAAGGFDDRR